MKLAALKAVVGVPEIVPVALSSDSPAGSVGWIVNAVVDSPEAVIATVIGVIAVPTGAESEDCEGVTAIGVTITEAAETDCPDPAELVATALTL